MYLKIIIILLFIAGTAFGQSTDSYSNKMYVDREQVRKFTDTDTIYMDSGYERAGMTKGLKNGGLKCEEKQTLRNILLMNGATAIYGTIDYAGYNIFKEGNVEYWRFCQGLIFGTLNYALSKLASTKAALGFSLQVWGGVPDAVYYGVDKIGGGFGGFSNGNEFNMNKNLSHLNFMPTVIGRKTVRGVDLITNVILTTAIAVVIQF